MPDDRIAGIALAAGAGRRLRPLTYVRPKALCPVANVPLVDIALARLRRHVTDVAVNVHHLRGQLQAHLAGRVHLSVERGEALGTAGGVAALRDWIAGRDVLLTNADAWLADGLGRLLSGWDRERVRLLVVTDPRRSDFGRFRYAGACLLPWPAVANLSPEPSGLYEVLWRRLAEQGGLDLVETHGTFVDCGTPRDYLRANLAAAGGSSVVGEGSAVEGELVRSVVWPYARVERGERLVDAVRVGRSLTVSIGSARSG